MSKSTIKDSIQSDQIKYLKEGNKEDSSTLRFALSFINKEEKDKKTSLEDVFYYLQEKSDAKYMFLISIKDIKAGDEITANYNLYTYPKTGIGIQGL